LKNGSPLPAEQHQIMRSRPPKSFGRKQQGDSHLSARWVTFQVASSSCSVRACSRDRTRTCPSSGRRRTSLCRAWSPGLLRPAGSRLRDHGGGLASRSFRRRNGKLTNLAECSLTLTDDQHCSTRSQPSTCEFTGRRLMGWKATQLNRWNREGSHRESSILQA
jgi:hypothetical protein